MPLLLLVLFAVSLLGATQVSEPPTPTPSMQHTPKAPEPPAPKPSVQHTPAAAPQGRAWTDHAKNLAQVVFWGLVATVSLLTYLAAKKTILQPIRTEIFKVQLEEMRNILAMFVGKGETELRKAYAFDKLLFANSVMMYDEYAKTFFDHEADSKNRPYGDAECPISSITQAGMEKHFVHLDDSVPEAPGRHPEAKDPRVRAALWADYEHYNLRLPKEFSEQEKNIRDLLENPLLPTPCVALLTSYIQTAHENSECIRDLLTECAKEMPQKYPSLDALKSSSFGWINNSYTRKCADLKPKADEVTAFIRSCYDVDNLLRA
jgi:hypothetical protein